MICVALFAASCTGKPSEKVPVDGDEDLPIGGDEDLDDDGEAVDEVADGPDPEEEVESERTRPDGFVRLPDPRDRDAVCRNVVDIDLTGDRLAFVCGYPTNRVGTYDVRTFEEGEGDPEAVSVNFAGAFAGHVDSLEGGLEAVQLIEYGADYLIPFANKTENEEEIFSGFATVTGDGQLVPTVSIDTVSFANDVPMEMDVHHIRSAVVYDNRLWVAATDRETDHGIVYSYSFLMNGAINPRSARMPIPTTGIFPTSLTMIDEDAGLVAVLNLAGEYPHGTMGLNPTKLDLLDLNATDPASALVESVDLRVVPMMPSPELAFDAEHMQAAIAFAGMDPGILIVDLHAGRRAIHNVIHMNDCGLESEVKALAVRDNRVCAALEGGKLLCFDHADVPTLRGTFPARLIDAQMPVGAIALGRNDYLYAVVDDAHIEAIDLNAVEDEALTCGTVIVEKPEVDGDEDNDAIDVDPDYEHISKL